ncbi:hypothetical protein MBLNU457_4612t1 [Dothideomycetes sp. NU457]
MKVDLFEADHGDDLDWQIIAEPGDAISWKKARPLDEVPLPRDQTVMVKPGTFISAMWLDEKDVERYEFAYVVAIREVSHSEDPGEPVLLVVSWLKTIRSTREGIKPWMKKLDLDRSSMILSTDFDIIELDCVADIVTDEQDVYGTVFTRPLAESEQIDGLAIALNCRRWFGRLNNFTSRIHNGRVRVETLPKKAVESPSPARKRKAKENLTEPLTSPKKSRVSPDEVEPTDSGSPEKPAPRGRTMVLNSTTVTRHRRSPVAADQSLKAPATARRSKVTLKPVAVQEEEDSSETLADAPDNADHLAALTLDPAPATDEKESSDPNAMELDSPKTVSETDAEFTRKNQTRTQSADTSNKLSEDARAMRASSAVPKAGLKVTFIEVDNQRTDEDVLAPIAENEEATSNTPAPGNDVFMGYDTTNRDVHDDAFGIAKLLSGGGEHLSKQQEAESSAMVFDGENDALRMKAQAALFHSEVATPEKSRGGAAKDDTRITLQDPTSRDELSKMPTPKINKAASAKTVEDGDTIKVAPKPGTTAVTRPNVGKKVTTEGPKPDPNPKQKQDAVVPKRDTTKKDPAVNQADSKNFKTKATSASKTGNSSATTSIEDQTELTKPSKKPSTPKKTTNKTAVAVDSPADDEALVKEVATTKKSATKSVATDDKSAKADDTANDSAATKKTLTKDEAAKVLETAEKDSKNKATAQKQADEKKKQTSTTKPAEKKTTAKKATVSEKTDVKKQTPVTKADDNKAIAKKTTAPKTAPKKSAASTKTTEPKTTPEESVKAQETAEQKHEEEQAADEDEDVDDEAIAEMEKQLAAMKAKRKSKA